MWPYFGAVPFLKIYILFILYLAPLLLRLLAHVSHITFIRVLLGPGFAGGEAGWVQTLCGSIRFYTRFDGNSTQTGPIGGEECIGIGYIYKYIYNICTRVYDLFLPR